MGQFVSRAGQKLDHAMAEFVVNARGWVCADLGSNTGGFVDCLLQRGASKVYAIETGYGVLDWKLRNDARVVVMERTNAMHATLPQPLDLVSIDVAFTRQRHILPAAGRLLKPTGIVITLIKPQYEAEKSLLRKGILPAEAIEAVLEAVKSDIAVANFAVAGLTRSPITGAGGNVEFLALLQMAGKSV